MGSCTPLTSPSVQIGLRLAGPPVAAGADPPPERDTPLVDLIGTRASYVSVMRMRVVDGRDLTQIADRLTTLLADTDLAHRMGQAGRAWVERDWRWQTQATRMRALLTP